MREFVPRIPAYPPQRALLRPCWGIGALLERVPSVAMSRYYDAVILQRELLSTLATLERFSGKPRIFDIDDAIFIRPAGRRAAERIARLSDCIICGNTYLADRFATWNPNVVVIPTAVDTALIQPRSSGKIGGVPAIGWIGTQSNLQYVYSIEPVLAKVLDARPDAVLKIMSDAPPAFKLVKTSQIEVVRWAPDAEREFLQSLTIGIMPLSDTPWEKGKCSFKMLQYMASGIPTVVSPVGMNKEVLALGNSGFAASSEADWVDALLYLLSDDVTANKMGEVGRKIVEAHFSTEVVGEQLAQTVRRLM